MMQVFSDKESLETIVLYPDKFPNWFKIFGEQCKLFINMSKEDYELEKVSNPILGEFIKINTGREPIPLSSHFDKIANDFSLVLHNPRSVYFLDLKKEITEQIQKDYGIIVQSVESIDDNILTGKFKYKLIKGEKIEDRTNSGWKHLLKYNFPPSNSVLVLDNYLLPSIEKVDLKYVNLGKQNLIWLLDSILPTELAITYHVTVISEDNNQNEIWRNNISEELNNEINNLRDYDINVEVVFIKSEHFHERLLLMNYLNFSCEHGFCVFKARDGKTVHVTNKLQIDSYFSSLYNNQGQSEFNLANEDLLLIKKTCNELAKHILDGNVYYKGAVLGSCNPNKSLKNRLINDV